VFESRPKRTFSFFSFFVGGSDRTIPKTLPMMTGKFFETHNWIMKPSGLSFRLSLPTKFCLAGTKVKRGLYRPGRTFSESDRTFSVLVGAEK
jgi:hypothetical protein